MQLSRTEAVRAALAASSGVSGQNISLVSGAAISLDSGSTATAYHGIMVKALTSNTDSVWVGIGSGVTSSTGLELNPGEGVTFEYNDLSNIYGISTSGTQSVSYIVT